jgi:hypothetical protein
MLKKKDLAIVNRDIKEFEKSNPIKRYVDIGVYENPIDIKKTPHSQFLKIFENKSFPLNVDFKKNNTKKHF